GEEWFEKPCMVPEGVEDNSRYPVSWDIYDFDDSLLVSSGWNSDTVISYGSGTYPQDLTSCASIPAGSFMMGNDWDEWIRGYSNYANPPHSVELDGFRMSYTEITQGHWELVMGSFSFSNTITEGDLNLPVAGINWKDAAYFCNKLSVLGGVDPCYDLETWNCDFDKNGFRLPTEAEWEYACRAGTKTSCYVGNPPKSYAPGTTTPEFVRFEQALKRVAWFFPGWVVKDGERVYADPAYVADRHPVRGKYANNFGLYDMLGNVSELCHNVYSEDFYDITPNKNPRGPGFVSRGGCYGSEAVPSLLSAYRYEAESYSYGNPYTGFRIVRRQAISEEEPE
ncbi:MAG: formylglycine-generating enzyme family protein, partial [Candidatus Glassbacteria bacterium]|nr:formylglycine-generating enzyme family protein [Candidatus Glassbacteria bacterium]